MKKILLAFIIGSSLPAVLTSNLYIGGANASKNIIKRYEFYPLILSALTGLANVVNYKIYEKYQNELIPVITGISFGIFVSSIGRFMFDYPVKMFSFTRENEWLVHVYAAILYASIFYMTIHTLNKWYLY